VSRTYSYPRYLEAKRSVDDRALNRGVLQSVRGSLATRGAAPLRVLEIGGGTGSMVRRLAAWDVLKNTDYTLVDRDEESLAALPPQAPEGFALRPIHSDITEFLKATDEHFDLVIAHAVLDLIDLEEFLPLLWSRCAAGARYWFTINFDGESVFMPKRPQDAAIWQAYHESMNRRPGSCHAGRKLFEQLPGSGARIEAAGSSDWVVHANDGVYKQDEAYFLHHIVYTIDNELRRTPPVDSSEFARWIVERHEQIDRGEMVYIAHQLDFAGSCR
jgi:SAM-dependent methyltransferase